MADPEHLDILEQGASAWNAWRAAAPDVTPDLVDAHLSRRDLRGYDFSRAKLARAMLDGANVSGATFASAWLKEAIFNDAVLESANFTAATASGARFINCDLRSCALNGCYMGDTLLWRSTLTGMELRTVNLSGADLHAASLCAADLSGATLARAHLLDADLRRAALVGTDLQSAQLIGTHFDGANLSNADLTGAHIVGASFRGVTLSGSSLQATSIIGVNLSGADISGSRVFGISAWRLDLTGAVQNDLIITAPGEPVITCDDVEIAQLIYLLLNNEKLRNVIDTVGKKAVLILGRFSPERKAVLDALREGLRARDLLPILFDFEKPAQRDLTETVSMLAHLSRFIVADLTDARSIPQELQRIVPDLPSVPVVPLLAEGPAEEYAMFEHFRRYPWVHDVYRYAGVDGILAHLDAVFPPTTGPGA